EERGGRSSRVNEGLASATTSSAKAKRRSGAPRLRTKSSNAASTPPAAQAAHTASTGTSGANEIPKSTEAILLAEPLEQRRDVHLIRPVIAGQRGHHDVDPRPERELALPRVARNERQHGLAVGADRPGAAKIVGSDEDRRDAVPPSARPP